jgi:hypothetical protein
MAIKAAIRNLIVNDATLAALVGTRVSPVIAKTGDILPRIAYLRTNTDQEYHLTGSAGLRFDTFNIVINSNSSDECDAISEQLKIVFEAVINATHDTTYIHRFYLDSSNEGQYLSEGREKPIYEIIHNWRVSFQNG